MPITDTRKQELIQQFRVHESDTGSPEVQIAILSEEIANLTEHLKSHRKDFASRRGLLKMVGRRQKLMSYLKRCEYQRYLDIKKRLELRHS
jgi:small subunit ribosomal protein S15